MTVASALIGCMVLSFFSSDTALARASLESLSFSIFSCQLGEFVGFLAIAAAQFGLDRLELFVEVIFALGLLHLALDPPADLALDLEHAQFAFHEAHRPFRAA